MTRIIILLLFYSPFILAQDTLDLSFESTQNTWKNNQSEGWSVDKADNTSKEGSISMHISSADEIKPNEFGTFGKSFPISVAKKRTIQLKGWIKTENVQNGFAGFYVRIDGDEGVLDFDNMADRGITGTTDWTEATIELHVPQKASNLVFGGLLAGSGEAWFDNITITLDGLKYWEIDADGKMELPAVLLTNVDYLDVLNGTIIQDRDILIEKGFIKQIASTGTIDNQDFETIDLKGKVVMPGLIDAHVHLFQSGGLYTRPDAMNLTGIRSYTRGNLHDI